MIIFADKKYEVIVSADNLYDIYSYTVSIKGEPIEKPNMKYLFKLRKNLTDIRKFSEWITKKEKYPEKASE